ncbi:hypothetical protein B0H65DRAFT_569951 [Neurospora tetraspora]|uniref:Uncharacterized protein n=1 Tax=Neurospora tetraspora TaxID=94610 RepID=A0AAE0JGB3_9PEZI|nr:hypothetical protein B0H65DRAFT_569951 [Neurospora tetraspora]
MDPYQKPLHTDIYLAMRPLTGTMMPRTANAISILSTFLLSVIGGFTIGTIFISPVLPDLLRDLSPMAIAIIKVLLSTVVLGGIVGTMIGGIFLWRREVGYDYEDLEANRSSSSIPSPAHPYDDYDYFFTCDPDPYAFSPYQQYNIHEHNTSHDDRSSNPDGSVSHQSPDRAPSDISYDSDPYTSDLYDDGYETDSDSSLPSPLHPMPVPLYSKPLDVVPAIPRGRNAPITLHSRDWRQ